jgi:chromosome segregation ATPase
VDSFRDAVHACEIAAAKQAEQLDIIRRDVEISEQSCQTLADERIQLTENLSEVERERTSADEQQTDIEQGNATTREDVSRAQGELYELRKQRESIAGELTEHKVRRMALSKERDAVYAEQKRLVAEHRELTLRLTALEHEAEENAATIAAIEAELDGMRTQIESDSADDLFRKRDAEEDRRRAADRFRLALRTARAARELLTNARDLADRIHKQELAQSKLENGARLHAGPYLERVRSHLRKRGGAQA